MSDSPGLAANDSAVERDWLGIARDARSRLHATGASADLVRELLVIGLDSSPYAIAVERVREIVRMRPLTRIPRAPDWLVGVVALRGEVVEVVDLRRRLGIASSEPGRSSRIIVLHGDADRVTGVLVDSVRDVYRVPEAEIRSAEALELSAVVEICPRGDRFISILDIDSVLGFHDE